ncbi:uncharacterized protein LOC21402699 [Morus notabilis]|uniref:uncharacterized protein LOC21402699 n=1 Tax=Morus notabilis TaxID=981085 RepID=UPI000CED5F56|nr:uncharacterized protein LOC21402699 [Morus notabilis]
MPEIPSPHGGTSSSLDGETLDCRLLELRNASSDEHDDRGEMSDESDGETYPVPPPKIHVSYHMLAHHASGCPTFHRRDAIPSHYLLKIESFSSLSKLASVDNYRSEFEAGGYKWEVSIYPTGDKKNGGQDHISVFLRLLNTNSLPVGWEVNAIFTFFVFDQIRNEYVSSQDTKVIWRYHSMKTRWGIQKFIDLETFSDRSNGYLVNGTCTFGAEVFVVKNTFKGECLSAIDEPITCTHTWKIDSFSSMTLERYESNLFVGGDYKWRIVLYPYGFGEGKGNSLSLFLQLDISTLPSNTKLFVSNVLRLKHQISGKDFEEKASNLFTSSAAWGFRQFMSLAKFKHPENGYLVGDTCTIEAQFEVQQSYW